MGKRRGAGQSAGGLVSLNDLDGASHSLTARHSRSGRIDPHSETFVGFSCKDHGADAQEHIAPTLRAMHHVDGNANGGGGLAVAHTLRGEGHDATEDGSGRSTPIVPVAPEPIGFDWQNSAGAPNAVGESMTLVGDRHPAVAIPCDITNGMIGGGVAGTVDCGQDRSNRGQGVIAFDTTQITSKTCRAKPVDGGPCHALSAHAHAPALAFQDVADPICANEARTYTHEGANFRVCNVVPAAWAVRRLTPRECERLMGYPDDFTLIPYRGKPAADGPRYRALGNSMCINVMRWLGQRIDLFERLRAGGRA